MQEFIAYRGNKRNKVINTSKETLLQQKIEKRLKINSSWNILLIIVFHIAHSALVE